MHSGSILWRLKKICKILHISSKHLRQFEPFAACPFFDFRKPHLAQASFSGLAKAVRLSAWMVCAVNFHLRVVLIVLPRFWDTNWMGCVQRSKAALRHSSPMQWYSTARCYGTSLHAGRDHDGDQLGGFVGHQMMNEINICTGVYNI